MGDLIFDDGFRANVGIVIFNQKQQVFERPPREQPLSVKGKNGFY